MKKLLILVSLCAALAVPAAPGDYLTLNASGTTSAQVIFPADVGPARVVAYDVTDTFTLAYPATRDDTAVIADVSTGLATGDTIIISPASTGVFANQIAPTPIINDITSTVRFPSAVGIALTAGDRAWLRGTGTHTLIGNATVRQQGEALYGVGAGKPLLISITGQAACSLNAITLKYD